MTTTTINNNIKTYRHEFGKEFMADLSTFAKVHQFDDRHTYKSEWAKWSQQDNIAQAMEMEKRRLEENGYKGDIEDKMFKAGRYYFRKKTAIAIATAPAEELSAPDLPTHTAAPTHTATAAAAPESLSVPDLPTHTTPSESLSVPDLPTHTTPSESLSAPDLPTHTTPRGLSSEASAVGGRTPPSAVGGRTPPATARRPYITMSKNSIKMMDEHIRNASTSSTEEFKPSSCYSDFYQTKMTSDEMTKEIGYVIEKYEKTPGAMSNITPEELTDQIMDKIKKTYKNRYYKYTSSASASNNAPSTTAATATATAK